MQIECYAQRLLNPFRGVVHVIVINRPRRSRPTHRVGYLCGNDALLDAWAAPGGVRRFPTSATALVGRKGLKRGPLFPSDDFKRLEDMGAVAYEHLLQVHRNVPFGFRDAFELWLLDRQDQPLALLHSVRTHSETDTRPPLDWRAGMAAQEHFQSAAIADLPESAGPYLTRYVNSLASGVAQWFHRSDEGAGLGCIR